MTFLKYVSIFLLLLSLKCVSVQIANQGTQSRECQCLFCAEERCEWDRNQNQAPVLNGIGLLIYNFVYSFNNSFNNNHKIAGVINHSFVNKLKDMPCLVTFLCYLKETTSWSLFLKKHMLFFNFFFLIKSGRSLPLWDRWIISKCDKINKNKLEELWLRLI